MQTKVHVLRTKGHCNTSKRHVWKQQPTATNAMDITKTNQVCNCEPQGYTVRTYMEPMKGSFTLCLLFLMLPCPLFGSVVSTKVLFWFSFVDVFHFRFPSLRFCSAIPNISDLHSSIRWEHPSHWSFIGRLFLKSEMSRGIHEHKRNKKWETIETMKTCNKEHSYKWAFTTAMQNHF